MHIERASRTVKGRMYFTHRFVKEHPRVRGLRRRTVLNLGAHFPVPRSQWKLLCYMVGQRLDEPSGQLEFDFDTSELGPVADDIARRVRAKWASSEAEDTDNYPPIMARIT